MPIKTIRIFVDCVRIAWVGTGEEENNRFFAELKKMTERNHVLRQAFLLHLENGNKNIKKYKIQIDFGPS